MDLQRVIAANKAAQQQARALNVRAGENLFPVMNREQIADWLRERLGGARSAAEVQDPASLAFSAPDAELAELVLGENPDEISVIGRTLEVEYRPPSYGSTAVPPPRVRLSEEAAKAHGWRDLPDEGVRLPGGRMVEVVVPFGYYDTVSGQDIPELKSRCVSRANKSLWENWPTDGRPAITLPDPADPASVVPEIIEASYGTSVVDGTPLVAFGVVAISGNHYYASDPWFVARWCQGREEAKAARAQSAAKLESIREEAIKQKRMDDARKAAEAAREAIQTVQAREGWFDLEVALRDRADRRRWDSPPSGLEDLQAWTEGTLALVAETEAALAEGARLKAERCAAFGPLLEMREVEGDVTFAERIDAFVRDCIALRGAQKAAEILRDEAGTDYGRGRRTDALSAQFRDVDHRGLEWKSGCDIWPVAKWAEHLASQAAPVNAAPAPANAPPASAAQVSDALAALRAKFGK